MLVLRRKEGQWVEITHKATGQVLRIGVARVRGYNQATGTLDLLCDDAAHNFDIQRAEREPREVSAGTDRLRADLAAFRARVRPEAAT